MICTCFAATGPLDCHTQDIVSPKQAAVIVENFNSGGFVKDLAEVYWAGLDAFRHLSAKKTVRISVCAGVV